MAPIKRKKTPSEYYRTPTSQRKKRKLSTSSSSTISDLVDIAVSGITGNPFAGEVAKRAIQMASGSTQTASRKKYMASTAVMGGKIKKKSFKKVKRKFKGKKGLTKYGLHSKGCCSKQELRFITDGTSVKESVFIGHTTMPRRQMLIQIFRTCVKWLMNELKIYFRDFTDTHEAYGGAVGDIFRIKYFNGPLATAETTITYTVTAGNSFEFIAMQLAAAVSSIADFTKVRLAALTFETTNRRASLQLSNAKITFFVKSALKVQNRTVTLAEDNEADDVNNVPLSGKIYHIKGNNLLTKTDRKILEGVGNTTDLRTNETMLYGYNISSTGDASAPLPSTYVQLTSADGAFTNPSEGFHPYEIIGCKKAGKIRINPGVIKTSILTQRYTMLIPSLLRILLTDSVDTVNYNARAGLCNVMFLERMIGTQTASVSVAAEVQLDMYSAISSRESSFTNTVQYVNDFSNDTRA